MSTQSIINDKEILCQYGCGQPANFLFNKIKKYCCSSHYRKCPFQATKIGSKRIGSKHSEETKRKIGIKSKERIEKYGAPFKGKHLSEETKEKISIANKGKTSWNKGLTKNSHPSIMKTSQYMCSHPEKYANPGEKNGMFGKTHTSDVKNILREKNLKSGKWKDKDNPWFGKSRSGILSPRYLPATEKRLWLDYKREVRYLSEQCYASSKHIINPSDKKRGFKDYHLDHIIPMWYGFTRNIPAHILAKAENLRFLFWKENYKRSKTKIDDEGKKLLQQIIEEK